MSEEFRNKLIAALLKHDNAGQDLCYVAAREIVLLGHYLADAYAKIDLLEAENRSYSLALSSIGL